MKTSFLMQSRKQCRIVLFSIVVACALFMLFEVVGIGKAIERKVLFAAFVGCSVYWLSLTLSARLLFIAASRVGATHPKKLAILLLMKTCFLYFFFTFALSEFSATSGLLFTGFAFSSVLYICLFAFAYKKDVIKV